jgi:flagellar hook-basal body complex protein FliE
VIPLITPITAVASASPGAAAPGVATGAAGTSGASFSNVLGGALDSLGATASKASTLAVEGATGQASVADVTVAANEAQLAVQLATTTRDNAVTAFNSIMSMAAG